MRFDGRTSKGIMFTGRAGDPVVASRNGRVVLISSALADYGTLIVMKHDEDFITAYAHLGKTLVQEQADVVQGQPIAEMASGADNKSAMVFEIRKAGVPVDPENYLPAISY